MDSKLKTQTFRFTNQFKVEGFDEEESIEASHIFHKDNFKPIQSDEESIEEEINQSFGGGKSKVN